MIIGVSMEMTRVLRNTWHLALNAEWYSFLREHTIYPLSCYNNNYDVGCLDLVILTGGNDMHDIITWRNNNHALRDDYELKLIKSCQKASVPIMGVCRGSHFINYALGGTHKLMTTPYDNVIVKLPKFEVTCHHSIQIDKLAPGFEILEQDSNGIIELAVNTDTRMLGVGWHPEREINKHTREYILDIINNL